ncbi:MAG: nitrous oxide reductase family maturation protein NosD [Ignavibacteriales bacterium]|nr:nitrous oxide reductase family maturation protein NosD [Ignavibacteriales bacterium]
MKYLVLLSVLYLGTGNTSVIRISLKGHCKTIQEAVRIAKPYDSLTILEGIYSEKTIIIDKPLQITGHGKVIINAAGDKDLFFVQSDNVQISGLHFKNVVRSFISDNSAIKIESAKNCRIVNNFFTNNFFAVYLSRSSGCVVQNNTIISSGQHESSSGNGIHLWNCRDITIKSNRVAGHRDGIYLEFSKVSYISNNTSEKNLRYGLHFMFSDSCKYYKNEFSKNGAGVAVMYSRVIEMKFNTFVNNQGTSSYGLLLKDIKDSQVANNIFHENTTGIFMEAAMRISLYNNTIRNCGWGIKLMANSTENIFKNNNFLANTFDITSNSRHDGNKFSSNYWDSYKGYDFNRDGIGDVPYYPVSLFSVIVAENPALLVLLKSFFVSVLDATERIAPVLTAVWPVNCS